VFAVSDAWKLYPDAEVLVSADSAWWYHHKPEFEGRKFSAANIERVERLEGYPGGINSGTLAIAVARHLGAKRIVLLGFDGHGSHFFGEHPEPLKNTTAERRRVHVLQHEQEAQKCRFEGVEVFNCTPGTSLTCYPLATLEDVLCVHG
jgi:hypothetical protein